MTDDTTLLLAVVGFASAIVGGVITGIFTYKASTHAATRSIAAQERILQAQALGSLVTAARVIWIDTLAAITEMARIGKTRQAGQTYVPCSVVYSPDFSRHIANLATHLDFSELSRLNRLYGLVARLSRDMMTRDYFRETADAIRQSADLLGGELFGPYYEDVVRNFNERAIDERFVVGSMTDQYRSVFQKLKEIRDMPRVHTP